MTFFAEPEESDGKWCSMAFSREVLVNLAMSVSISFVVVACGLCSERVKTLVVTV